MTNTGTVQIAPALITNAIHQYAEPRSSMSAVDGPKVWIATTPHTLLIRRVW